MKNQNTEYFIDKSTNFFSPLNFDSHFTILCYIISFFDGDNA